MTKKQLNEMRSAMYKAFIETEEGQKWYNLPSSPGCYLAYEVSTANEKAYMGAVYSSQINNNTIREANPNIDPDKAVVKLLFTAWRGRKIIT